MLGASARAFAGELAAKLLNFVAFTYVARAYGPREFGAFAYALALAVFASTFMDAGLKSLVARETGIDRSAGDRYLAQSCRLVCRLAPVAAAISLLAAAALGASRQTLILLALLDAAVTLMVLHNLLVSWFLAVRAPGPIAATRLVHGLWFAAGAATCHAYDLGVEAIAAAYLDASAVALLGAAWYARKLGLGDGQRLPAADLLRAAFPYFLLSAATILTLVINPLLLRGLADPVALGLYAAAGRLVEMVVGTLTTLGAVLFPAFAALQATRAAALRRVFPRLLLGCAAAGLATSSLLWLVAPFLVPALYGQGYGQAQVVLQALSLALAPLLLAHLAGLVINVYHAPVSAWIAFAITLPVNVALGFWLVPSHGALGAAVAWTAAAWAGGLCSAAAAWRLLYRRPAG